MGFPQQNMDPALIDLDMQEAGHISEFGGIFLLSDSEKVLLATSEWFSMLGRLVDASIESSDDLNFLSSIPLNARRGVYLLA